MRQLISKLRNYFIAVLIALVTACSGVILLVEGGISGTGISFGSIAAFASVIVNGTKLEIGSQTEIFIDGQPANENDLNVGYVIRVDADFDNRIARRIDYIETVGGPIVTIPVIINPDTLVGRLNVLGQTVLTNSATIFDGIDGVAALAINDVLDVSGVRDSSGAIIARYVQLRSSSDPEYRLVGEIASHNPAAFTFAIGDLEIDYSAPISINLSGGVIQNGIEVRVKGLIFDSATPSLVANEISDSVLILGIQNGDSVELEGAITQFSTLSVMEVNGFPVDASAAIIEDGDENDIVLDALVEVEGSVDISNILIASKVKILPLNNIRIRAAVDSVNTGSNTIVVLGVTFQLNERTQLEDNSSAQAPQFSLLDLSEGNWVRLRGYTKVDGSYILSRLVRRDDPDPADIRVRLQAPVDVNGVDKDNKTIILLGITVSTDPLITSCEDVGDVPFIDCDLFFDAVKDGDIVKAKWLDNTDISLPVGELSLE